MPLDIYQNLRRDALDDASQNIAPDLPAGFGESFGSAVQTSLDWSNSNAYSNARSDALDTYMQGLRDNFGAQDLVNPYRNPTVDDYGRVTDPGGSLDDLNAKVSDLAQRYPDFGLKPLTPDDIDKMTLGQMQQARQASAAMAGRERTWGGTFGGLGGSLVGGAVDPVNIALMPLGGLGGAGLAARAGEFAAIGAVSQAANEVVAAGSRERAVPGTMADVPLNIAEAALSGAGLGAGLHGLGVAAGGAFNWLRRTLGHDPAALSTSARDDLHAATSEAQIAATNVLPGAAGEMANRDALTGAVRAVAGDEPVRVADAIPPDLLAAAPDATSAEARIRPDTAGDRANAAPPRPRSPLSINQFIARNGGLALDGDVRGADLDKLFVPGGGPLARKTGRSIDGFWRERLIEEGYLPPDADGGMARDVRDEVMDAVRRDQIGDRVYTPQDARALADRPAKKTAYDREIETQAQKVRDTMDRAGVPVDETRQSGDLYDAAELLLHGHEDDPEVAFERAVMRRHLAEEGAAARETYGLSEDDAHAIQREAARPDGEAPGAPGEGGAVAGSEEHPQGSGAVDAAPGEGGEAARAGAPAGREDVGATIEKLRADPAVADAVQHDLEHIMTAQPGAVYREAVTDADGNTHIVERPLADVMRELDEMEIAARELEACVVGQVGGVAA